MLVEVRLFATLRPGRFKKQQMDLPEGADLHLVLDRLDIAADEASLPLVNGRFSPLDHVLVDGDVFSIFPAVGGG